MSVCPPTSPPNSVEAQCSCIGSKEVKLNDVIATAGPDLTGLVPTRRDTRELTL